MDFSFQLYSARNFPPTSEVLAMLARLGYKQVEGFGGVFGDPAALAADMKANGLTMPTAHFSLDQLKDVDGTLKLAETLGVKSIVCPFIPQEFWKQTDEAWVALAGTLAGHAETYGKAGYDFGWHNHHFEFWATPGGNTPMDIILDTATNIFWEMDVAWVVKGSQDPLAWIDRYADRIKAVHLKDIAPEGENADEDGWADLGHGTIDWPAVFEAVRAKTPARYFIMEHDNPNDLERFASRSLAAAQKLGN